MKRFLALALACFTATCGGDGGTSPVTPTASSGSGTAEPVVTITITSENGAQSFSPNPASAAGQRVVFRNVDSVIHRVVLNDGSVDTGDIPPGATSREVVVPVAGANYHLLRTSRHDWRDQLGIGCTALLHGSLLRADEPVVRKGRRKSIYVCVTIFGNFKYIAIIYGHAVRSASRSSQARSKGGGRWLTVTAWPRPSPDTD